MLKDVEERYPSNSQATTLTSDEYQDLHGCSDFSNISELSDMNPDYSNSKYCHLAPEIPTMTNTAPTATVGITPPGIQNYPLRTSKPTYHNASKHQEHPDGKENKEK
jgi:hypothetical protein